MGSFGWLFWVVCPGLLSFLATGQASQREHDKLIIHHPALAQPYDSVESSYLSLVNRWNFHTIPISAIVFDGRGGHEAFRFDVIVRCCNGVESRQEEFFTDIMTYWVHALNLNVDSLIQLLNAARASELNVGQSFTRGFAFVQKQLQNLNLSLLNTLNDRKKAISSMQVNKSSLLARAAELFIAQDPPPIPSSLQASWKNAFIPVLEHVFKP